ncbi:hypothetical protein [Vulcanisaeta sp. JCM 16161]|uniref:hypothetical protein n=1 Tax=Vulcanisaeta sp. JCM 16161 TaxID=1295372 RepID=UPI0006D1A7A4|nr:hypothetical protein [Vulcanisaeta sp. JCM 16161]
MEEDREVIRASSIIAPLIILTSLVLLNYVINGLPYIPDSWVHIAHSETILRTGYLFGPSQNPSMVSYNYKWPTVNLLLALSQSVLGLGPLEAFYVVSILASLSIVPFVLFVRRLTGSDVVA